MCHICFYSPKEGFFGSPVEKLDINRFVTLEEGGHQTVHSVNYLKCAPIDQNRGKQPLKFHQPRDVIRILPFRTRRFAREQRCYRERHDFPDGRFAGCSYSDWVNSMPIPDQTKWTDILTIQTHPPLDVRIYISRES